MFPCLMARNEIPSPILGRVENSHPRSIVTLLPRFRLGASLAASSLLPAGPLCFPIPHLRLNTVLPSVDLPSDLCFFVRGRPLSPVARPDGGAPPLVAVGVPCGDHLVVSLLIPITHICSARCFLTCQNVSVPCV